nr:hypothetical protein [uncultured Deefgea sp.]
MDYALIQTILGMSLAVLTALIIRHRRGQLCRNIAIALGLMGGILGVVQGLMISVPLASAFPSLSPAIIALLPCTLAIIMAALLQLRYGEI